MLGKVFENSLRKPSAKSKGSFYTPREIVHYMCQESLINYLDTAINTRQGNRSAQRHRNLHPPRRTDLPLRGRGSEVSHENAENIEKHARLIDEKLSTITVCDPAVGSGAFPVGMMTEIVRARCALTPYFNDVYKNELHTISNATRSRTAFTAWTLTPAQWKSPSYVCWLSLVVDEEDVKQIKPLPNLDYKIVTSEIH